MLNKSNSRSEYTVQSKVTQYPVGFKFFFDGNNAPQVLVKIGGSKVNLNVHYKFSEDLSTLILIPLEEEKPTNPSDYSWLNKWVGKKLVIERNVAFVNESDYQVGKIAPEQIEKDFDLSVMRDQMLQQQITDNDADLKSLFDTVAEHREDIDHAQDSADDAMAHSVALQKRVAVNETGIATNKSAAARAQKTADDAMAHSVALEKRVSVNETGIATNKSAAARAQKTADDAMTHTVAVEKRVTQAEKNITSNDADIANIFSHQDKQDGRLTNLENSKIDKDQGINNVGKVMTVGGDGIVVPKASHGGSGIGVVAHDETLVGAGTDEYPLGVKNKVTITIVEH
jgi:hypothetical protein